MKNQHTLGFFLQLFGEEAMGETGEPAPLQSGDRGEAAPSKPETRGEEKTPDEQFEELIRGQFKEQFGKRVSQILQRRLKQQKTHEDTKEFLEELSTAYGVEQGNLTALKEAVLAGKQDPLHTHALAGSVYQDLSSQAKALGEVYPSFNLNRELKNPKFAALLTLPDVDMQTAFELTHKEEILPAVIAAAVEESQKRIAKGLMSGGVRPRENGVGMTGAALVKRDVSTFSKEQMEDICKRVSRGEKIYL